MMKKKISMMLALAMSASCIGGLSVMTASAADGTLAVGDVVKFDFGASDQTVADGYYSVTPDTEYNSNVADGLQFGLYGGNVNDYKLPEYEDGVRTIQGQYIDYVASGSGSAATDDYIGVSVPDGQIEGNYPIRFSMAAENNSYYNVKVTVTTFDSSKDATVNVYSERRHPIVTKKTITAGTTETIEFSTTIQSVLIKDRSSGGTITYKDSKLNVAAVGDNVAVSSIVVEKIDPVTTIWCYNDSTGCDYAMRLPYFALQNYGGTAQYLSKYLAEDIALVNQGDGGLNAGSKSYFNLCKENIKEGDYIYLQYGHNHKTDGPAGYVTYLNTYYSWAAEKGANMVFVGPIDRHNATQYNSSTNTWSSTLGGFSKAGKYYADLLTVGGSDLAEEFVSKVKAAGTTSISDEIYAWADEQIAGGITDAGVTNAAFVDLNAPTLEWLSDICEDVKTQMGYESYKSTYTNYYYQALKTSSVDGTHENDLGADATASFFFTGIKELVNKSDKTDVETVQAAVLAPLVENMRDADWERVSDEIVQAGIAPNSAYPEVYVSSNAAELPIFISDIVWTENNTIESVSILKQEAKLTMDSYGKLELVVYDSDGNEKGTITSTQIDNTWSDGTTTAFTLTDETNILNGDTDVIYDKDAGDTFTAIVWKALDDENEGLIFDETSGEKVAYSDYYIETEVEAVLVPDEDGNETENFLFYGTLYDGSASIDNHNGWNHYGSSGSSLGLFSETDDDSTRYYSDIQVTTNTGSFSVTRALEESVTDTGRVSMSMDLRNISGNIRIGLANSYKTQFPDDAYYPIVVDSSGQVLVMGESDKVAGTLSTDEWTTVTAMIDMDLGTATVTVGDGEPVTADVSMYKVTDFSAKDMYGFVFTNNGKNTGGIQVSNLTVLKLKQAEDLAEYTLTVSSSNDNNGTVSVGETDNKTITAKANTAVTVTAEAVKDGYTFAGWVNADDETNTVISSDAEYTFSLKDNRNLKALFAGDATTIASYDLTADKQYVSVVNDGEIALSAANVFDADGVEVTNYSNSDITYSCDAKEITITDGVAYIPSTFALGEEFKDITFTSVLNGITKTCTVTAHRYEYYDDFAGGNVSATWDGNLGSVSDKYGIKFGNGYSGAVTNTLTLPNTVALDGTTTVKFSYYIGSGASQSRTISLCDSTGTNILNETIYYNWNNFIAGSTTLASSGSAWIDVVVTLNEDGTGTVSVGENSADITIKDTAADIAYIKLYSKAPDRVLLVSDIAISHPAPTVTGDIGSGEVSDKNLQELIDEAADTVTVISAENQEMVSVPSSVKIVVSESGAVKNTAFIAADDDITVEVINGEDTSVITASKLVFDENGLITEVNDGAVMKTEYTNDDANVFDIGFFLTKVFTEVADAVTYTLTNKDGQTASAQTKLDTTVSSGEVLFGLFITEVPEDEELSVTID